MYIHSVDTKTLNCRGDILCCKQLRYIYFILFIIISKSYLLLLLKSSERKLEWQQRTNRNTKS